MVIYSHSRLGTFQQCKYKYKLQYIDRIRVDVSDTIETFMGGLVHKALEKLYTDLGHEKLDTKEEIQEFFEEQWRKTWVDEIIIAKKEYTQGNYKDMGKRFLSEYYDHYKPFNQIKTIDIETQDIFKLENGNSYYIRIDRLSRDSDDNYYVCDYKTNRKLKEQEELDEDRQLAMYSLWVKHKFPDAKNVKLIWYFLAHDKEMLSERSDEQLLLLKKDIENLIETIEATREFPVNVTPLCGWCLYKEMCPAWKHELELEEKTEQEYTEDEGVGLVNEYAELSQTKKTASKRLEEIEEQLIKFARQKNINVIFGEDHKCSLKESEKIIYPKDKEEFIKALKDKGIFDHFSVVNYLKLN